MADQIIHLQESETDSPPLTEAYQKAHKQYGLFTALLIGWELVGFTVEEMPLDSVKVTLKSPEAIPYVLLALVVYFGYRLTIEWLQCDRKRRQIRAAMTDFWVAHIIGSAAIGLFVFQQVFNVQLIDLSPKQRLAFGATISSFAGILPLLLYIDIRRRIAEFQRANQFDAGRKYWTPALLAIRVFGPGVPMVIFLLICGGLLLSGTVELHGSALGGSLCAAALILFTKKGILKRAGRI